MNDQARPGTAAGPVHADAEEFYVGYLKMPRRLKRRMAWLVPGVLGSLLGVAVWTARSQDDPGDAVWHQNATPTFVGQLLLLPYPHLRVPTADPRRPVQTMLLVQEGKRGAGPAVRAFDGQHIRARGSVLERDGIRLLELQGDDALAPENRPASTDNFSVPAASAVPLGSTTLFGEIIDPKCYCGAMKPGEGKTHKACATLCIKGGIPPMFVTQNTSGQRTYYLLANPDGGPLDDRILPYVADPVEIRGAIEKRDDLLVLTLDPSTIRRR